MAENEKISVDTEDLKNETKDTVNKVKETIKNVDLKKDAEATKGFVKEMFSNPIEAVKRASSGEEGILKKVIIIVLLHIVVMCAYKIIEVIRDYGITQILFHLDKIIWYSTKPLVSIILFSLMIYIMNKNNKKTLTSIVSTMVVATIPLVIFDLLELIRMVTYGVSAVAIFTNSLSTMFFGIYIIIAYYGMKEIFGITEENKAIKKFSLVQLIVAALLFVLYSL